MPFDASDSYSGTTSRMQAEPEVSHYGTSGSSSKGRPKVFRSHDRVPAGDMPELAGLLREWVELNATSTTTAAIARWNVSAFSAGTRPADIVDEIDAANTPAANELTLTLLTLFQDGQALAGRILLQEFMPSLWRMRQVAAAPTSRDRLQLVIAEFWAIISAFPTGRGDRSVGGRIVLDTLNAVTRQKNRDRRDPDEIPVEDDQLTRLAHTAEDADPQSPPDQPTLERLVAWARRNEIIDSTDEVLLLTSVSATRRTLDIEAGASATGLTPSAARRRLSRARARLVDAARRELQRGCLEVPLA